MSQYENDFRLQVLPTRVFKRTPDFNREGVEGWVFNLVVESLEQSPVACEELFATLLHGEIEQEGYHYGRTALALLGHVDPDRRARAIRDAATISYWPWMMRVRVMQSQRLEIDRMRFALTLRDSHGKTHHISLEVPIKEDTQKTELLFPFRGNGIITQGGVLNEGHCNRSGQFAIDALGLTEDYAPVLNDSSTPDSYAGWGRPILAPTAGLVVRARGDRPDQPVVNHSDPHYYAPEYPHGGDPGNYVVIDHEQGEFSMIAHLRQNSLTVSVGQTVKQGDQLGELGNSGDSTGPHLHHQLQAGPDWEYADALPHHYLNGPKTRHDRGWYFSA